MRKSPRHDAGNPAAAGLGGAAPYGWSRLTEHDRAGAVTASRDVLEPAQARVILDAVAMLRRGDSLRSTAKALNERGIFSPRRAHRDENGARHPVPWLPTTLKQVLLRARNAGLCV